MAAMVACLSPLMRLMANTWSAGLAHSCSITTVTSSKHEACMKFEECEILIGVVQNYYASNNTKYAKKHTKKPHPLSACAAYHTHSKDLAFLRVESENTLAGAALAYRYASKA